MMHDYKIRTIKNVLVVWFLFSLRLFAMGGYNSWAAVSEDTLRLFYWQAPTSFNPHLSPGLKDWEACRITYEPLASFDADGILIPILAAEIPSLENGGVAPDGKSVIWKLKPNVTWSDGHPFTSDDVLFTYEFISNPETKAYTASTYEVVERVETIDELTVKLHFKTVNPAWTIPFVGSEGMILPRHILEQFNNAMAPQTASNIATVGTGPYHMTELAIEDTILIGDDVIEVVKIIYEPNPFFREEDNLSFTRIELLGGGDATTAARLVLAEGSVDFAWNLQVDHTTLMDMQTKGKGKIVFLPGPHVERILLNVTDPNRATESGERSSTQFPHPFFSEKKVRQAFAHAIDRKAIAALYGDSAQMTTNLLVSPSVYNSPNTTNLYPFDLERAATLLNEAGWIDTDGDGIRDKDGIPIRVLFQTSVNPVRQKTQQIVKEALESLGIDVELKMIDASVFFSNDSSNNNNVQKFYADLQEYYSGNPTPDPISYMGWWTCDQVAQQANNWSYRNHARWCCPEYDALYEQASTEVASEKRRDLFIRMNDLLIEGVVLIPLINRTVSQGISNTLEGIEFTVWDRNTWNIKDWRRKK